MNNAPSSFPNAATSENRHQVGPEPFIDKAEVARRLGKTTRTVEVWSKKGYLPFVKVGRSCLYRWPDIETRLLENHGINCPPR